MLGLEALFVSPNIAVEVVLKQLAQVSSKYENDVILSDPLPDIRVMRAATAVLETGELKTHVMPVDFEAWMAAETEVPGELLAVQRRAIYARLEQNPRKSRVSWVPSLAAALLLALAMFTVFKPAAQKQAIDAVSEDEVLEDVFKVASRSEPAAVGPVKFLFEVQE